MKSSVHCDAKDLAVRFDRDGVVHFAFLSCDVGRLSASAFRPALLRSSDGSGCDLQRQHGIGSDRKMANESFSALANAMHVGHGSNVGATAQSPASLEGPPGDAQI